MTRGMVLRMPTLKWEIPGNLDLEPEGNGVWEEDRLQYDPTLQISHFHQEISLVWK